MTREEAIKLIPYVRATYGTENFRRESYTASEWFKVVEEALTVEVVRCKECKWRGEYLSCPIPYRTDDDFFCGKGEKRNG